MKPFFGALLVMAALPVPIALATNVSIDFVANSDPSALHPSSSCPLGVAIGANGTGVLDAALAAGCIDSYSVTWYGNDAFVDEIDGLRTLCPPPFVVCGYWAFYVNGTYSSYSISDYSAAAGDEFRLTYDLFPANVLP